MEEKAMKKTEGSRELGAGRTENREQTSEVGGQTE
jgi:hypothetical protein